MRKSSPAQREHANSSQKPAAAVENANTEAHNSEKNCHNKRLLTEACGEQGMECVNNAASVAFNYSSFIRTRCRAFCLPDLASTILTEVFTPTKPFTFYVMVLTCLLRFQIIDQNKLL
ncbi:hypothetical protein XENOCAPTIV_003839 [Xenoophorus captivus]|uniref:Uncharacterized protein n=1 Tax=Xenoophorus captivus TaxID=1517983 RepID=A0ABV0QGB2_9TELE